jgi:general secretion pathway protein G
MKPGAQTAGSRGRTGGFTRFEFAVCAALSALLAGVLLLKLLEIRAQMERAVALQLVASARTAMAVRVARLAGQGGDRALEAIAQENPVTWLARAPGNYQGEYYRPGARTIKPGHWYFDRADKTLNYLLSSHIFSSGTSKLLRFKVELSREPIPGGGNGRKGLALGLVLGQLIDRSGVK